jgi:hypothetical protein
MPINFFQKKNKSQILLSTDFEKSKLHQLDTESLYVFYDLDLHPISYDVTYFIVACEIERKKRGLKSIHVVFVPMADMFAREVPENYDQVVDLQSRLWRFDSICTQIPRLMASVSGITICGSRDEAALYRELAQNQYPVLGGGRPAHHADYFQLVLSELQNFRGVHWGLAALVQAKRYVNAWLTPRANGRKPVIITLRQYQVDPARNSDPAAWTAFASGLDPEEYFPVFVPDTDHAHEYAFSEYKDFAVFEPAAWSVGLRMAIYELAYLNMFVNTGPNSLAVLSSRCRYIFFKVLVPNIALTSADFLQWLGFSPGETPNFATPYQKWLWSESDQLETLNREFTEMCKKIEPNWGGSNGD